MGDHLDIIPCAVLLGKSGWSSGLQSRLPPLLQMLYVDWVSVDLNLTSRVFSGHSAFLPPQKLTHKNRTPFKLALLNWTFLYKYWPLLLATLLLAQHYHFAGHYGAFCGLNGELGGLKCILAHWNKPIKSENQIIVRSKQPIKLEKPFPSLLTFSHSKKNILQSVLLSFFQCLFPQCPPKWQ